MFSQENSALSPSVEEGDHFISFQQLILIFKKLNNKKSSSFDGIPNIILKNLPPKIIMQYCIVFNNAINNCYFPAQWKKGKVIALLKKDKDSSDPENYRPISLLPNISKIFEAVINMKLTKFCHDNKIIADQQFGFRAKHSTTHAISKILTDTCKALNNNKCVGAMLIDLEKAFDTVWIDGLIFKLIKKKFPRQLVKIILNMLTGKAFMVADGNSVSEMTFVIEWFTAGNSQFSDII